MSWKRRRRGVVVGPATDWSSFGRHGGGLDALPISFCGSVVKRKRGVHGWRVEYFFVNIDIELFVLFIVAWRESKRGIAWGFLFNHIASIFQTAACNGGTSERWVFVFIVYYYGGATVGLGLKETRLFGEKARLWSGVAVDRCSYEVVA